ncbi:hypothetical protein KR018_009715 [Drosophila ironensis]|nr:hypothetical protein KR018_009715 [Drosophila ironensis]
MATFFGVYIPPTKIGFEGSATQCAGSIAAQNIKPAPESPSPGAPEAAGEPAPGSGSAGASSGGGGHAAAGPGGDASEESVAMAAGKYEDPDYPPDSPLWLIFTEKSKALDVLRHYKEARLREFPNREQAESYVQFGFESIEALKRFGKSKPASKPIALASSSSYKSSSSGSTDTWFSSSPTGIEDLMTSHMSSGSPTSSSVVSVVDSFLGAPSSPLSNGRLSHHHYHHHQHHHHHNHNHHHHNHHQNQNHHQGHHQSQASESGERPAFRAPTKQELVEFRKQIEAGNLERVRRVVWENPRFLISSGDTPTSLKEGCRYNAMHICAQVNEARIAELLLKILADREFTQLYAGKKGTSEMCAALSDNLVDYYLNMPDKARGETPLHFAAKNGHIAVVEVLTAHPLCKSLKNHEGKEPKNIICLRAPQASQETIMKLELLMYDPHYVPVLRSVANELPPQVGQPFRPNEPPNLQSRTDECEGLSVDLQISALAGPMPREKAMNFYRRWKTPPRVGANAMSPMANSPFSSPVKQTPSKSIFNRSGDDQLFNSTPLFRRVLFSPLDCSQQQPNQLLSNGSGNECENNNNNNNIKRVASLGLPITPVRLMRSDMFMNYRGSSIDDSVVGASDVSLNVSGLNVSGCLNDSFRERHIKNSDIEKGLEVVGRQLARQEQLEWREFWDFLDAFVDISTPVGLARLEAYFAEKAELTGKSTLAWNFSQLQHALDNLVVSSNEQRKSAAEAASSPSGVMTPYTCVEKSLQVFAKRITKTLINNIGNMVSINDTLLCELKRLKSLIVSFKVSLMEAAALPHCRIAELHALCVSFQDDPRFITVDFGKVHSRIAKLVASYVAHSQEMSVAMRVQLLQMLRKLRQLLPDDRGREQHLGCVCGSLLQMLEAAPATAADELLPEALKTEEQCSAAWESQPSCACLWDANLSRKTSRRKRTESMRAAAAKAASINSASGGSPRVSVVKPIRKLDKSSNWRRTSTCSDDDDEDESDDSFFDCIDEGLVSSSSEDGETFKTPPESLSPHISANMEPAYELFIFGKEPTKRDLDVLNAIFHVDVDKEALPYIYAWKTALESFSAAEMDL